MIDFTDHNINYVLASYGVSFLLLAGMAVLIVVRDRRVRRAVALLPLRQERARHE